MISEFSGPRPSPPPVLREPPPQSSFRIAPATDRSGVTGRGTRFRARLCCGDTPTALPDAVTGGIAHFGRASPSTPLIAGCGADTPAIRPGSEVFGSRASDPLTCGRMSGQRLVNKPRHMVTGMTTGRVLRLYRRVTGGWFIVQRVGFGWPSRRQVPCRWLIGSCSPTTASGGEPRGGPYAEPRLRGIALRRNWQTRNPQSGSTNEGAQRCPVPHRI